MISRRALGLEGTPWTDLITPAYTGPLSEEDVREDQVFQYGCDMRLRLDSSCQAKIHAGPSVVKAKNSSGSEDSETKFILDLDLFMGGNVACTLAAAALETLHAHADRVFEGAVTDTLRDAIR